MNSKTTTLKESVDDLERTEDVNHHLKPSSEEDEEESETAVQQQKKKKKDGEVMDEEGLEWTTIHWNNHATNGETTTKTSSSPVLKQVLSVDALHYPIDDRLVAALPSRCGRSNRKGRHHRHRLAALFASLPAWLTWWTGHSLKGLGMFVNAYIIITTGQLKLIWQHEYPECWVASASATASNNGTHAQCPNLIQCCGIFANNPLEETVSQNGTTTTTVCRMDLTNADVCNPIDGTFPDNVQCHAGTINALSYAEFAGIMLGMLTFGFLADGMGRTPAGLLAALLQVLGVTVMTFYTSNNNDVNTIFLYVAIFFGIFGWGVGGEYPLTAHHAAEAEAEASSSTSSSSSSPPQHVPLGQQNDEDAPFLPPPHRIVDATRTVRRGETIAMAFTMQGIGAVMGSLILLVLLYFSGQSRPNCTAGQGFNASGTNPQALNGVWRTFYYIGGLLVVLLLAERGLESYSEEEEEDQDGKDDHGKEDKETGGGGGGAAAAAAHPHKEPLKKGHDLMVQRQQLREATLGPRATNKFRILWQYAPRLLGTGGSWMAWDITFYGLRLFSGPIFNAINPGGALIVQNGYLLLNNLIALVGYYCAAAVVDWPVIGRQRLQMSSFAINAILFLSIAAVLNQPNPSPNVLMSLYFMSSFFGQFGSNVTTYVMAAETYPTELRGTFHGLSAFFGKLGALTATISFSHITTRTIFIVCGCVSWAGCLLTALFGVDMTRVPLAEHDAQLELFLEGRLEDYKGLLNHPRHLSNWDLWTGRHGEYKPGWAARLLQLQEEEKAEQQSGTTENASLQPAVLKESRQ